MDVWSSIQNASKDTYELYHRGSWLIRNSDYYS